MTDSELPSSADATAPVVAATPAAAEVADPPSSVPSPGRPSSTGGLWRQPLFWLAAVALALAAWQWIETRHRLLTTQEEVARRLAEEGAVAREARTLARQTQENTAAMLARVAAIETRMAEFQGQQAALEGLYQELARGRDEWTLAEVEQIVALAAQQLQLAGNVQAAVQALTNADARLARADRPQFLGLRKIIARDLGRLRALPFVDVAGISVKLEGVVNTTDALALAFEERPRPEASAKRPAVKAPVAESAQSAMAAFEGWWGQLAADLWQEVRSLVRIERFDRPEPALLSPTHAFFLRENLKLRLLNARLALLARDQATFRGETRQAVSWLERHFDVRDKSVQAALSTLRPLASSEIAVELPSVNDSLTALRAVRLGRNDKDGAR